jgi:uncharacterized protein
MRYRIFRIIAAITLLLSAAQLEAQLAGQECFPKKENKLVYDEANVLSPEEESNLEKRLVAFADSTSNQITVVIVVDLCGMDKSQFAIELGESWGVGQSKEDNGVVFLVKPKTSDSKGEIFIAVGRGLEGAIPDITAKQITDNECIPYFKKNAYFEGISRGTEVLMELARGEYNSDEYAAKHTRSKKKGGAGIAIIALLIIGLVGFMKASQAKRYAQTNQISFWAAWALINAASRSHRGYYSNFSSGRGGFGGFGGGGSSFGGFGGGGFGGGGAGGSW